jgi:WD40 repeat protein
MCDNVLYHTLDDQAWDETLRVWDLESGKGLALLTADSPTASCAVSLDGRTIVAGDGIGSMHILRMEGFS